MTMDVRVLILKVKNEPKLDARVRKRYSNAVVASGTQRFAYVRVFVNIEYAPNLVPSWAPLTLLIALGLLLACRCFIDQSHGTAVHFRKFDSDVATVQLLQSHQIARLSFFAFGQYQK